MGVLSLSEHTDWLHRGNSFIGHTVSRLGRGIRKVIPSCVIAAVRHEFLEADGIYTGFLSWQSCSLHLHYLYHKHSFP